MNIEDRIAEILVENPNGMKASEIAKKIGCERKSVNRYLYAHQDFYEMHEGYVWTAKTVHTKILSMPCDSRKTQPVSSLATGFLNNKNDSTANREIDALQVFMDDDSDVYYRTWKLQIYDGSFAYGVEWSVDNGNSWHSCAKTFSEEWEAECYLIDRVRWRKKGHFY